MKNFLKRVSNKLNELNEVRKEYEKKKSRKVKLKKDITLNSNHNQQIEIDISATVIIKIILIFALFLALKNIFIELQSIVIISTISFFLALGLSPIVKKIESFYIPRPLAIIILYLIFFSILVILFVAIIPILAEQLLSIAYDLKNFISNGEIKIPFFQNLLETFKFDTVEIKKYIADNLASISENLRGIAGSTLSILSGIFQGVFNLIFALVLMFFILLEREKIANFSLLLLPAKRRDYIKEKFESVQEKMSKWFRGQFILMISMGTFMYVGMKIFEWMFGMKYAATIGLLAGIMELFPYIGVLITGVLCLLIAINISWLLVAIVLVWIGIAQFLEGNFLVPLIMEKVVGLSSVVTILAIAIGGILGSALGGVPLAILGMIFSVPIVASVAIFVEEYIHRDN
ncbi:AI-2E family transporter [Candidatus Gracilibacteria bacterium]|nr:AI-2E family transporter [Candidatus Gracilibacteria bacterium]